jgi:hypothetical protein
VTRPSLSLRMTAAVALPAVLLTVMARLSAAPLPDHPAATARLRLSWSARPERIETCRTVSAEELQQREEHMRQRLDCEGVSATYALRVEVDDRVAGEAVVHGAGLRHDRPLYLLQEFDVAPGAHRVRVTFTRRERTDDDAAAFATVVPPDADTGLFAGRAQREATEHSRRARAAIPPRLALDTTLTLEPRRVALVTFDPELRVLELHTGHSPP